MLEILAPAGNAECAKAAIDNGANAIYLGYNAFSARQNAENFDEAALSAVVQYAHFCGVRVYVAMNTIVKEREKDCFLQTLLSVWAVGVDAVIMQDLLLGKWIKASYPEIVLHASTQAGICNEKGALFAKECGFSRVILARETPLGEIGKITKIIETEAFVQGALCTCFSGQCYFSSFAGGNSGNRGRCKQPCRKLYAYDRNGNVEKNYALSLSDLCVGENIQKYIDAGVTSFKIEGRLRRVEYVAAAVRYYRALLDGTSDGAQALSDLKRTFNRGNYTSGLAFGQDKRFLSTQVQGHIGEKLGVVKVVNGKFYVESRYKPRTGDAFKILREGKEVGGAIFVSAEAKGFVIGSKCRLKNGDSVFITTDTAVCERVLSAVNKGTLTVRLYFTVGEKPTAEINGLVITGDTPLQAAQNRPLDKQQLRACFEKTDGLPVDIRFDEIYLQGDIFIAKSELNAFRRKAYAEVANALTRQGHTKWEYTPFIEDTLQGDNEKSVCIADDFTGVTPDIAVYKPNDYQVALPESFLQGTFEKYLYYPALCTSETEDALKAYIQTNAIDGIYAENYAGALFARENGLRVFAGVGWNLTNTTAIRAFLSLENASYYMISKELNETESKNLASARAFMLSSGDIKLMDLCYCPFGKTCGSCDKKSTYLLTDEQGRVFPVRRVVDGGGICRFEVYNCAHLIGAGVKGVGKVVECVLTADKISAWKAINDENLQKTVYKKYTSGHAKRGVL